uniref:Uncharacterized protein n=1 Tax=Siphoviridae sp. ctnot10 TaxID=2826458 RepID=A0A8S5NDU6_9CAUD|nr:MAG TPA: hypothetical protein [Siphoviridae sp. ctnot10]DAX74019.1 MAG TPA: hypothetical protein [Caudoviricetes sp.]
MRKIICLGGVVVLSKIKTVKLVTDPFVNY